MPFFANTPEALVGRSDSRNPSTTCRGITSNGRACRRPLAPSDSPPRMRRPSLRVDDPSDESLYCWQHKDQASASARSSPGPCMSATPILEERTSIDTLAERLNLLDVSHKPRPPAPLVLDRPPLPGSAGRPGPDTSVSVLVRPRPKKDISFCLCFTIPVDADPDDAVPAARPKPRPVQTPAVSSYPQRQSDHQSASASSGRYGPQLTPTRPPLGASTSGSAGRASDRTGSAASAQTHNLLSLIPADTSPQTASLLMAELAKPTSETDEAGYIYMFWLTPESQPEAAPAEAARSLLTPPSRPNARQRRPSDVLQSFASEQSTGPAQGGGKKKTMLLKIGRANNVQRRLNEWTRQCGYNLSLIRFYPYVPSGGGSSDSSPSASVAVRKVPHSHRVERLIHLELAGKGLRVADREKCTACGREHREWFEVDATRQGVEDVDEVIRRWADWNESLVL